MNRRFFLLPFLGMASFVICSAQPDTRIIAHRGYWQCEHSAENSLTSLFKADEAGVYASEFDVILTKDGVPVVHHDDSIQGMRIEDTPYVLIRNKMLKNGEKMPTLEQYLIAGKQCNRVRLVLEIKPHLSKINEQRAVDSIYSMVCRHGMQHRVDYISFSLPICERLRSKNDSIDIAYLSGDKSPAEIKKMGLTGIDYYYKVFYEHPEWVKEAHDHGLTVNVWTVNKPKDIQKLSGMGVDFITTNIPAEAKNLVNRSE